MDPGIDRELARLRRRALGAALLGEWSRHLLMAGLGVGAAVLLARAAFDLPARSAAWSLALVAATPVTAWLAARRRFLSRAGAAAWLDVRAGATGLVLTDVELEDERWRARAAATLEAQRALPRMHVRTPLARAAGGLAFVALAITIELPRAVALGPPPALYDGSLEDLRTKLETLEETVELEEETRAELEQRLERLESEADDTRSAEATFEALDQLGERMDELAQRVEDAAQEMASALELAGGAEEDLAARQEALAQAHAKLAEVGLAAKLGEELAAKLASAIAPESMSAFDLSELGELSEEMRAALEAKLAKLADAGLLGTGKLYELGEFGEGELGDLSQFELHECDESCKQPGGT